MQLRVVYDVYSEAGDTRDQRLRYFSRRKAFCLRIVVICLLIAMHPFTAFSAPPTIETVIPPGGQRGSKFVTTCKGEFSWPVKVWAPGLNVVLGEEKGKLEITVPADLAADRTWVRLYNEEGISAPVPFLIGNFPEIGEEEPNDLPHESQVLTENSVTINGVLQENGDVDGFMVKLERGQTLVATVDANTRLGSPMDAILQVASAEGFVLAENHDDVGLDPRLTFTAPRTTTYVVRLFAFPSTPNRSIVFQGEPSYIYRLSLTTGPFITHSLPLSVSQSEPGEVEVLGWNIPPNTKIPVVVFGGTLLEGCPELEVPGALRIPPNARIGLAFALSFGGSARVRLAPHGTSSVMAEPGQNAPMRLQPPIAVTGRLGIPREVDEFHVTLKKGEQVIISVESQNLHLPLSPVVRFYDPSGSQVTEVNAPNKSQEAVITHTATQAGDYRLTVGEQYLHGGERYVYCLTVRFEEPDFELSASSDTITVSAEKPVEFEVKILRRKSTDESIGAITLEPLGLPPGVTASPVVSEPTGETAEKVSFKFSTTGDSFSGPIRIVGTTTEPREMRRVARTTQRLNTSFQSIWLTAVAK